MEGFKVSKQRLMTFLMQWLIQHGTNRIVQYQMGVFEMDAYIKCVRLKYLMSEYDEQVKDFFVWLTPEGVAYLKENTK